MKRKTRSKSKQGKKTTITEVSGDELLLLQKVHNPDETGFVIIENPVFDIKNENVILLKENFSKQVAHFVIQDQINTKVNYSAFRKQATVFLTRNKQELSLETISLYRNAIPPLNVPLIGDEKSLGPIYDDFSRIIQFLKTSEELNMNFGEFFNDKEVLISILKSLRGGNKQGYHRDFQYSDHNDDVSTIKQKNFQESPKSLLFCVDDYLKIGVFPGSHKNGMGQEMIIKLRKGQAIIFHSELVHYGCGYDSDNYRVHFYLDNPAIVRPPETTYFVNPSERIITKKDNIIDFIITVSIEDSSEDSPQITENINNLITIDDSSNHNNEDNTIITPTNCWYR
jgi:hypothetical protein